MFPNTAIFYDVENFLSENYFELSLGFFTKLIEEVKEVPEVTGIAIQRAYANFCSASSEKLRNAILYAGIEPIQIYSLSKSQNSKNIADIQISIDIDELIHTSKHIEVYVIVSGDAGFSIIAKRIHQKGKMLIGCAREVITSALFKASCERFIFIGSDEVKNGLTIVKNDIIVPATPLIEEKQEKQEKQEIQIKKAEKADKVEIPGLPKKNVFLRKIADFVTEKYSPLKKPATFDEIKSFILDVAEFIESDNAENNKLFLIQTSILSSLLRYYDPRFELKKHGHGKFNKFLTDICSGTHYVIKIPENCDFAALCIDDGTTDTSGEDYEKIREEKKQAKLAQIREKIKKEKQAVTAVDNEDKPTLADEAEPIAVEKNQAPLKIGEYVRNSFIQLVEDDVLTSDDIKKLTQKHYSKSVFGISYPVLKEINANESISPQLLVGKTCRYWSMIFMIEGKNYVLCSAWYEKYRDPFEKWVMEFNR